MTTSLENFGTLEYVQDKYSKLWCWKITGKLAIDKISSLSSKAWYGENENEVIIEDSTDSIKQLKLLMDRFPLEILSKTVWQRKIVKTGKGEMQLGGVIYSDSADKAARFIMNCNQKGVPLLFIQDVNGFMVGSKAEENGIIKDGAKMVNAMSNSIVPKFTVIIGNSNGAGNYAMCGKAFDPRLIFSWPGSKIAVMGGEQAAQVLLQIEKSKRNKEGEKISTKTERALLNEIKSKYEKQTNPYYAAARLWTDAIIDPLETR